MSALNKSLQKKRCARIAAVQALYKLSVTHVAFNAQRLTDQLITQWKDPSNRDDNDWEYDTPPERALLLRLLTGIGGHRGDIQPHLDGIINDNWKEERMSPVLIGILTSAIYELLYHPDIRSATIVDEYCAITAGFFDDPELGFAHSALQRLASTLRQ